MVTKSRNRATGKFPSIKMKRMIEWESISELNAFRLLEANPYILRYWEQPCEIRYELDGKHGRHFPDVLVQTRTLRELWDVEEFANAQRPETIKRTELLGSVLN